ncbi:MAG: hypothetical protein M1840_008597 [Geoglossum simile]|nr:MAG: hypothetical protein M1840_008597 [Geoglossum simile]
MSSAGQLVMYPFSWLLAFEFFVFCMSRISRLFSGLIWEFGTSGVSTYHWAPCDAGKLSREISVLEHFYRPTCVSCGIVSGFYGPGAFLSWLFTILTVLHKYNSRVFSRSRGRLSDQDIVQPEASRAKRLLDPVIAAAVYPMVSSVDLVIRSCRRDVGAPFIAANKVTAISWVLGAYRLCRESYGDPVHGLARSGASRPRSSSELLLWKTNFCINSLAFFIHGIISKVRGHEPAWLVLQLLWTIPCLYIIMYANTATTPSLRFVVPAVALIVFHLFDQQITAGGCGRRESNWVGSCGRRPIEEIQSKCVQIPRSDGTSEWRCPSDEEHPGINECFRLARYKWSCQDIRYGFLPCNNSTFSDLDQATALMLTVVTLWIVPVIRRYRPSFWNRLVRGRTSEHGV